MCAIRRMDAFPEPTKRAVLDIKMMIEEGRITEQRAMSRGLKSDSCSAVLLDSDVECVENKPRISLHRSGPHYL